MSKFSLYDPATTPLGSNDIFLVGQDNGSGDIILKTTTTSAFIGAGLGAANGVASLDGSGKIPAGQLPSLVLVDTFVVADEAAQLAIAGAEQGDVAIRTDESKTYIHLSTAAGDMTDWRELATPTDLVSSVNGQTGAVTLAQGMQGWCAGKPSADEIVAGGPSPYAFTISAANCSAKAAVGATAETVFTLKNNGTTVGTFTFTISGSVATLSITGSTTVSMGDFLTVHAPSTADETLADIGFSVRN